MQVKHVGKQEEYQPHANERQDDSDNNFRFLAQNVILLSFSGVLPKTYDTYLYTIAKFSKLSKAKKFLARATIIFYHN